MSKAKKTAETSTETPKIERDKRRRARAEAIAKMGETGHPFAAAAAAMNKQVVALEDELDKQRTFLTSMLRGTA